MNGPDCTTVGSCKRTHLCLSAGPLLELLLVRGVPLDAQLDLLQPPLPQHQLGHLPVLHVPEEPVQRRAVDRLRVLLAHLGRELFVPLDLSSKELIIECVRRDQGLKRNQVSHLKNFPVVKFKVTHEKELFSEKKELFLQPRSLDAIVGRTAVRN